MSAGRERPARAARAGWATASVRLRPPVAMGGYAARREPARAVHDPLEVRALALGDPEDGAAGSGQPLILAVADLLAVDAGLVAEARRRLQARRPGARLWLAATHTHSGPDVGLGRLSDGPSDPEVEEAVLAAVLEAAEAASGSLRPVRPAWVSAPAAGVGTPRDHPQEGAELDLDLLILDPADGDTSGKPLAVFGSFPCHPTVLGESNLEISSDLPGAFRRRLGERLDDRTWVALATGAAGDVSTRHTRRGQDFAEVERLGGLLADRALELLPRRRPLAPGGPVAASRLRRFAPKEPPDPVLLERTESELRARLEAARRAGRQAEARTVVTALQGVEAVRRLSDRLGSLDLEAELAAAAWGELRLAAVPGELYHRPGDAIRRSGGRPTLLLGYANGYLGYIPEASAYGQADYEVLTSPFGPGAAEEMVSAFRELLAALEVAAGGEHGEGGAGA
ncbi:MAG: hypothetical protein QJR14_05350 [Bacillota bacterium]|nr:hypothetical protein [Bacillota bacterium]